MCCPPFVSERREGRTTAYSEDPDRVTCEGFHIMSQRKRDVVVRYGYRGVLPRRRNSTASASLTDQPLHPHPHALSSSQNYKLLTPKVPEFLRRNGQSAAPYRAQNAG